ncbi:hypothetical protein LZ31DRAFT_1931 [Colletotrichum somersetense]|nr:hypothetical protein LZ31DRAFT_1931 [Colletotrichum somersetense]
MSLLGRVSGRRDTRNTKVTSQNFMTTSFSCRPSDEDNWPWILFGSATEHGKGGMHIWRRKQGKKQYRQAGGEACLEERRGKTRQPYSYKLTRGERERERVSYIRC